MEMTKQINKKKGERTPTFLKIVEVKSGTLEEWASTLYVASVNPMVNTFHENAYVAVN